MRFVEQTLSTGTRAAAAGGFGIAGLVAMAALLEAAHGWQWPDWGIYLAAAAFGAAVSSAVCTRFFGQRSLKGWALLAAGSVLATTIGGFLGGLIWAGVLAVFDPAVPFPQILNGAFFCVFIVWAFIVQDLLVAAAWLCAMALLHVFLKGLRSLSSENSGFP